MSRTVTLSGKIVHNDNPAAVKFRDDDTGQDVWLPRSEISIEETDSDGGADVTMPEWLAIKEELI